MSDNIPIEIQLEIFQRLPVKSLVQIRSVCKPWKSLIDSADFINNYSGHLQYLLARYKDTVDFVLIADDHTFPQNRVSLNSHPLVNMLQNPYIIDSSHGLLCLYGDHQHGHDADAPFSSTARAVIWNPSIRKAVALDVSNLPNEIIYQTVLGFGVCRQTTDPKIVKITYFIRGLGTGSIRESIPWQVEVFTLSTGTWRPPYTTNLPRTSIHFDDYNMVATDGMLYWLATNHGITVDGEYLIISFNTTTEEFREVNLPDSLAHTSIGFLSMRKLKESVVVLKPCVEANNLVFLVWMMEDVVPKSFTKLFAIDLPDVDVLEVYVSGFRKTGEPIIDSLPRIPEWTGSLALYEPYSKSISSLGINGRDFSFVAYSFIETLLLL